MEEFELKFGVPGPVLSSLREALLAHGATPIALRAAYHDTPDGRLAAARVALRLRQEGDEWVQTLKAEGDSAVARLEHELRLPAGAAPALDLSRHDGTPAGERLKQALGERGATELQERHGTDVTRLRCLLSDARGTRLEVALDEGEAHGGTRRAPIAELEIEHVEGPLSGLFDLARAWTLHGGLWLSTIPKSARGHRLWRDEAPQPAKARPIRFDPRSRAAHWLRAIFHPLLRQVLDNASELAEGRATPELVHQLRIGLRRLRTGLRELGGLSGSIDPSWEPALSQAFARLGVQRDAQVVADTVRPMLQAAQAPLADLPAGEPVDMAAIVRDSRLQLVLIDLLAWVHGEDAALSTLDADEARRRVRARRASLRRKVLGDARRFESLPPELQHRVRKRLKRLRYLAEMTRPLWPSKGGDAQLEAAQEVLGLHNDLASAAVAFRTLAATDPRAWFATGFLQAQAARAARKAGKCLRKVRHSAPGPRRG